MKSLEDYGGDLLRKLVLGGHLNVPERQQFGRKEIKASEIIEIISGEFKNSETFPPGARVGEEGQLIWEGFFLQKIEGGKFRLQYSRPSVYNLTSLAEKGHVDFRDMGSAVKAYVEKEIGKDIDGIQIKWDF